MAGALAAGAPAPEAARTFAGRRELWTTRERPTAEASAQGSANAIDSVAPQPGTSWQTVHLAITLKAKKHAIVTHGSARALAHAVCKCGPTSVSSLMATKRSAATHGSTQPLTTWLPY